MDFLTFIYTKYPLLKDRDIADIKWTLDQVVKVVDEWQQSLSPKGEQNPKP